MEGVSLIGFLVVGLIAGWLGGKIMRGGGFGFFGNLIVGVVGAFLGGILFNALGITAAHFWEGFFSTRWASPRSVLWEPS